MHIAYIILLTFSISRGFVRGEPGEQRVVRPAYHNNYNGEHEYSCYFHNIESICTWIKDGEEFDPTKYGYYYDNNSGNNNCTIKAKDKATHKLQKTREDISCLGHVQYPRTIIEASLKSNAKLKCQSRLRITPCIWKRNGARIYVRERYSYANENRSNDCSIRIDNIEDTDHGEWTCSDRVEDYEGDEIVAAYTLLLVNEIKTVNSENGSSKNNPKMFTTTIGPLTTIKSGNSKIRNSFPFSWDLMIAVYVCIIIASAMITLLIFKSKSFFERTFAKEEEESNQTILHVQYTTDQK